jgi:hypothetical protein
VYENIGKKIKVLAQAIFILESIAAVITGIVLWIDIEEGWCATVLFGGPVVAWISSWLLYGFGELIDKVCDIERNTRGEATKSNSHVHTPTQSNTPEQAKPEKATTTKEERIANIDRLLAQGLITEDEYKMAISRWI